MEERQRVAIIRDLHERAQAQRAANEAWTRKVEERQAVADGVAKKARYVLRVYVCMERKWRIADVKDMYVSAFFSDGFCGHPFYIYVPEGLGCSSCSPDLGSRYSEPSR